MMHITEDTPPDMLTGAMDLTVQLPSGPTVKMSVERSTPMMDVLVLITTQYNLQVSRHAIEALGLAPSQDKVLPYRPNTPLGALDTQHIRVVPKTKAAPPPRPAHAAAAHQPFESTFRLKVHLPRNQLYVVRVSRCIYLEDVMRKVCDDKNLDARKYEFRHPGNLDRILDSKMTISDYQITEVYLVVKGTLTAFSSSDIMALRREEEKKQMHTRAGGGVFNLIFKKGRNSLEHGSVSSENRSVSPSHSDDSRSVTPPAIIATPKKPKDQPKPPQRKRKPAPKPPAQPPLIQPSSSTEAIVQDAPPANICHSRTSSDSSGYHEASILSDNLISNSSLPRAHHRPKTTSGIQEVELRKGPSVGALRGGHSKSTGNLARLSGKSKSTTSLVTAGELLMVMSVKKNLFGLSAARSGRKKKAAPLPPPQAIAPLQRHAKSLSVPASTATGETGPIHSKASDGAAPEGTSADGASHPEHVDAAANHQMPSSELERSDPPKVRPRVRAPAPHPRQSRRLSTTSSTTVQSSNDGGSIISTFGEDIAAAEEVCLNDGEGAVANEAASSHAAVAEVALAAGAVNPVLSDDAGEPEEAINPVIAGRKESKRQDNYLQAIESINIDLFTRRDKKLNNFDILRGLSTAPASHGPAGNIIEALVERADGSPKRFKRNDPAEVPATIGRRSTKFDTLSRKRGFQIGSSLTSSSTVSSAVDGADSASLHSSNSQNTLPETPEEDDLGDVNVGLFSVDAGRRIECRLAKRSHRNELYGIHDSLGERTASQSVSSVDGIPGFRGIRKWNNVNNLDGISLMSTTTSEWVIGEGLEEEFVDNVFGSINQSNISSLNTCLDENEPKPTENNRNQSLASENSAQPKDPEPNVDWKYELPLPPTAFRDNESDNLDNLTHYDTTTLVSERFRGDSVVSNPELFEKLNKLKETRNNSSTVSAASTEDDSKPIYNKLSLELLQKRNSLVYNREIATTLKSPPAAPSSAELEDAVLLQAQPRAATTPTLATAPKQRDIGLPNFRITTYDEPKSKINIYEDDTIRSNQSAMLSNDNARPLTRNEHAPVARSGSFSINTWSVVNPLKRSTSQAALVHRRAAEEAADVALINAGGLQSLGVMKLIRSSLESPPMDTADCRQVPAQEPEYRPSSFDKAGSTGDTKPFNGGTLPSSADKAAVKPFKRWTPPDISLGTWSDRPKTEVIVKRDSDYAKFGNGAFRSGGVVVISNNNNQNGRDLYGDQPFISRKKDANDSNNVSIKINGSEPISSSSDTGNVTIRIGPSNDVHCQPVSYRRRPFGTINAIRPHSIAVDANYGTVSRRPVVTAATLKKSVTQISSCERPAAVHLVHSNDSRRSWNALLSGPREPAGGYNTNVNVPFSQMRLKRTDSSKILTQATANGTETGFGRVLPTAAAAAAQQRQPNGTCATARCPPPPPQMPAANQQRRPRRSDGANSRDDPRSALLSAIQNFGGKSGLRTART